MFTSAFRIAQIKDLKVKRDMIHILQRKSDLKEKIKLLLSFEETDPDYEAFQMQVLIS